MFKRVVVDYGHGDSTPGKRYTFTDRVPAITIREYLTNRETAWRVMVQLLELGVEVWDAVAGKRVTVAPTSAMDLHPSDTPLSARVKVANGLDPKTTLFLSCHSNAVGMVNVGPSQKDRGAVFYTSPGQTTSDRVATSLHDAFEYAFEGTGLEVRKGNLSDGDPDEEANFYVLTETRCPAVMGEVLYFTNAEDAAVLLHPEGQDLIADAYVSGLRPWLS